MANNENTIQFTVSGENGKPDLPLEVSVESLQNFHNELLERVHKYDKDAVKMLGLMYVSSKVQDKIQNELIMMEARHETTVAKFKECIAEHTDINSLKQNLSKIIELDANVALIPASIISSIFGEKVEHE